MLKLVEVAQYLTNKFNEIGATHEPAYSFNIQAEVGANKNAVDVQGIVKTAKPKLQPVLAGRNATYNLIVELSVVAPTSNFNLKNIEEIVNSFASEVNGQEIAFENGKGFVTLTLGQVAEFKTEVGQGNIVPLSFDMVINYTEGVATSKSKHWFLQVSTDTHGEPVYEEIPYISESVLINKEGRTNKINGKKYSETFALGQQKRYRFTFLYDENSLLCPMIQKDMLDGKGNKTYKLKYYDGITYTAESPYVTTVMLFETGDTKSKKPEVAQFDIIFADADDGEHTTKYYLALLDNPFDEATENTKCFEETTETITINGVSQVVHKTAAENQIEWYNGLIQNNGVPENEIPACNISSVYLTNQTYVNTQNSDLFDIVNKNYARIRVETTTPANPTPIVENRYFYYWTKNPAIGMEGQVTFDLSLDSLQTFLFQDGIKFEGNLVERACLNRWVEVPNDPTSVMFDGKATSKLFERENLKQVAKRLATRTKLDINVDTTANSYLNRFLKNGVIAWCYIYLSSGIYKNTLDANIELQNLRLYDGKITKNAASGFGLETGVTCLCYPICDKDYAVAVKYTNSQSGNNAIQPIRMDALQSFLTRNEGWAKVYSVKLSVKPPFPQSQYTIGENADYYIDDYMPDLAREDVLVLPTNVSFNPNTGGIISYADSDTTRNLAGVLNYVTFSTGANTVFLMYVRKDTTLPIEINYNAASLMQNKFLKSSISGTNVLKDKKYNPKLNNSDYKELQLAFISSNETYDIQKLNNPTPTFEYYEPLSSDVTKGLVQYKAASNNEVYGTAYSASYNGLSYTNDLSLPIANSQLDVYLANNKNAYLSFQNQQERQEVSTNLNMIQGLTTGVVQSVAGSVGAAEGVSNIINGAFSYIKMRQDQSYQRKQFDLTMDDMKSAPNVLQNVNGSALLAMSVAPLGIYAETHQALPHELEIANDDMFMNGFTYNLDDDIFPYINKINSMHLRKNFNYIQAIIGNISGITISNEARNDLRQRLANGVRFWHINNIDYVHENSERWLSAPVVSGYASFTTTAQYVGYYVIYKEELTLVTTNNKDNLDITAGTTIAYSNVA